MVLKFYIERILLFPLTVIILNSTPVLGTLD